MVKIATEGKVFAYKNEDNEEIILGSELYLGKNDDGSRYYEVDDPNHNDSTEDIVVE